MRVPSRQLGAVETTLQVPGAQLRYRDTGTGPALLLIHGWALDLDIWEPSARRWEQRYRVIRFDRRGFGLSTGEPSLAADVADALAVLEQLNVPSAVVIGASQGARAALRLAIDSPTRVAGLILDGPADELGGALDVSLDEYRRLMQRGQLAAVRTLWSRHPFTRLQAADEEAHELLAGCIGRYPGRDLAGPAVTFPPAELARCLCPVRVLSGASDLEARRLSSAALARVLPSAELVTVPGAGHLAHLDRPEAYDAAVLPFLKRVLSRSIVPGTSGRGDGVVE
jgi:pimeloyl-ACP methyl ester carboxylesterase